MEKATAITKRASRFRGALFAGLVVIFAAINLSGGDYKLHPGNGLGSAKAKDKKEEFLSQILERLNELFLTDGLTDRDLINYAHTFRDKVSENTNVMSQILNNTPEQAMLGDFPKALDDAVLDSSEAHQKQMMQILSDPGVAKGFARVVFDLIRQAI